MKKIISALVLCPLLVSCVQSMKEMESTAIAGTWAVVNENDMASGCLVFDHGHLYEYRSHNRYLVHDGILWGVTSSEGSSVQKYRYSYMDGSIYYENYYKNVRTTLSVDGDVMMIGKDRCLRIKDTNKSKYSKIILSETNKLDFLGGGEDVEWSFQIENPVDGIELTVVEAPAWCGGAEGVRVSDGKIHFTVPPTEDSLDGRFVFSYLSADDVEVPVNVSAPVIVLAHKNATLNYDPGTYSFAYEIRNPIDGIQMEVECNSDWVTDIVIDGDKVTYSVTANNEMRERYAYIFVSYFGVKALYSLTQTFAYTRLDLTETSDVLTYEEGVYSFNCRINDPREGLELQATSDVDWINVMMIENGSITYSVDRNDSGSARSGHITLTYSNMAAEYTITQSYSRGYAFWVGDWIFTGADGYTQKVTFSPGVPDKSFLMTGFLGISDSVAITVDWYEESQIWKISNQKLGKMTVPSGWRGEASLYGLDYYNWVGKTGVPICTGQVSEDGSLTVVGEESYIGAPYNCDFKPVTMIVYVEKGSDNQVYRYLEEKLNFPFTVTPADAE